MMYHPQVQPYLNTTPELDNEFEKLFGFWNGLGNSVNIDGAVDCFLQATLLSPNLNPKMGYVSHCFQVTRRCEQVAKQIGQHYSNLQELLNPREIAFMGLTEDALKLIGGNGTNNPNRIESGQYHEILTFIQVRSMGYEDLANAMGPHFVALEILAAEQAQGRFQGVEFPNLDKPSILLDIVSGVDALCTSDWLPDQFNGQYKDAFEYRVKDIIERKKQIDPNHPLIIGLQNKGSERLEQMVHRLEKLVKGEFDNNYVTALYGL